MGNDGIQNVPKRIRTDMYYACSTNAESNSITASITSDYVNAIHHIYETNTDFTEYLRISWLLNQQFLNKMLRDIVHLLNHKYIKYVEMQIYMQYRQNIHPTLSFYSGVSLMTNKYDFMKEERDNGTKCIGLKTKMKRDCSVNCKN